MWLPGQAPRYFPRPLMAPKARSWSPPKPPKAPQRTLISLDAQAMAELLSEAERWKAEAARLQEDVDALREAGKSELCDTSGEIEVQLGMIVLDMEKRRMKIETQIRTWDRNGGGAITKGEFRLRLKQIGLDAPSNEVDQVFDKYDGDHSGVIDLKELKHAFSLMKQAAHAQLSAEEQADELQQKIDGLQARIDSANQAVVVAQKADQTQEELQAYKAQIESQIDLQLGDLLVRRGIKVGEIVGTWPKARGREQEAHKRELSRSEFKDAVQALGLEITGPPSDSPRTLSPLSSPDSLPLSPGSTSLDGCPANDDSASSQLPVRRGSITGASLRPPQTIKRPATRRELGRLFDQIDEDHSGWLDLKEAKTALKSWQERSREATLDLIRRERTLTRLRRRAATKIKFALNPPAPEPLPAEPGASGYESSSQSPTRLVQRDGGLLSRINDRVGQAEKEAKKAAKQAAQERAKQAIRRMANRQLASGWSGWHVQWLARQQNLERLRRATAQMMHRDCARALRVWQAEYAELLRLVRILNAAAVAISHKELLRGWHSWGTWLKERREMRDWEAFLRKKSASLRRPYPRLVAAFFWWRQRWAVRYAPGRYLPMAPVMTREEPSHQRSLVHVTMAKLLESVAKCVDPAAA